MADVVKGEAEIAGGGLWQKGHQVRLHVPGHWLHGFAGSLSGRSSLVGRDNFLEVLAGPRSAWLNVHDLRPAVGFGWPDLETGDQPVRG